MLLGGAGPRHRGLPGDGRGPGIGLCALYGFYFLLVLVYPAGMGFGDVKLAGVLGGYLGWVGYGALVVGRVRGLRAGRRRRRGR